VIGVDGARETWVREWDTLLPLASSRYTPRDTAADDPALIIYTSGTTGNPKGALIAQRSLIGNLSGFVCSHDFYPQRGDMFWSPADWAWTGGLFDALLPSWALGQPILGYRGRFDPEKAFWLMEKYGVRNSFLFPTALKMMMKAVPQAGRELRPRLRSIMSAGETVGETVCQWAQGSAGRHHERDVRPDRDQLHRRQLRRGDAAQVRRHGARLSGPPRGRARRRRQSGGARRDGRGLRAAQLQRRTGSGVHARLLEEPAGHGGEVLRRRHRRSAGLGPHRRPGEDGRGRRALVPGALDDMFKSAGYRIGPGEIENCLVKHAAVANAAVIGAPDETRGTVVKAFIVLQPGQAPSANSKPRCRPTCASTSRPTNIPRSSNSSTPCR
jgi:acetyl-CoA synthetase